MPTYDRLARFIREFANLTSAQQREFRAAVAEFIDDLRNVGQFRPSLRVKGVQTAPGIYEMTWAKDGRATWEYGPEQREGHAHIVWRRVGTHDIFTNP